MLRSFAGTGVRTIVALPDANDPAFWSRHCRERRVIANPKKKPEETVGILRRPGRDLRRAGAALRW